MSEQPIKPPHWVQLELAPEQDLTGTTQIDLSRVELVKENHQANKFISVVFRYWGGQGIEIKGDAGQEALGVWNNYCAEHHPLQYVAERRKPTTSLLEIPRDRTNILTSPGRG